MRKRKGGIVGVVGWFVHIGKELGVWRMEGRVTEERSGGQFDVREEDQRRS